jgi:hypothetical protein
MIPLLGIVNDRTCVHTGLPTPGVVAYPEAQADGKRFCDFTIAHRDLGMLFCEWLPA